MKHKEQNSTSPELQKLGEITNQILSAEGLKNSKSLCRQLESLISRLVKAPQRFSRAYTRSKKGAAVSPQCAAKCLRDNIRSVKFMQGIHQAVAQLRENKPNQKIRLLYAGCGPYATLILPLLTTFSPEELEISLLDIHQESLDHAQKIIEKLGVEDSVAEMINDDATTYQHQGPKPDIIVSETMDLALQNEPQAAITANLAPQLNEDGIFIPQSITIEAFYPEETGPDSSMQTIFSLTKDISSQALQTLSSTAVEIPAPDDNPKLVCLATRVKVFDNITILPGESSITSTYNVGEFEPQNHKIRLQFQPGAKTQLDYSVKSDATSKPKPFHPKRK